MAERKLGASKDGRMVEEQETAWLASSAHGVVLVSLKPVASARTAVRVCAENSAMIRIDQARPGRVARRRQRRRRLGPSRCTNCRFNAFLG